MQGDHHRLSLPVGYLFRPHEEELVAYYLSKKTRGEPLPCNAVITTEFYALNPLELTALYGRSINHNESECYYFFTNIGNLKMSGAEGKKINRIVKGGEGVWNGVSKAEKHINGVHVYTRRDFKYCLEKDKKRESNWKMQEFRIETKDVRWLDDFGGSSSRTVVNLDWVLCKVYQVENRKISIKGEIGNLTNKASEEEDEGQAGSKRSENDPNCSTGGEYVNIDLGLGTGPTPVEDKRLDANLEVSFGTRPTLVEEQTPNLELSLLGTRPTLVEEQTPNLELSLLGTRPTPVEEKTLNVNLELSLGIRPTPVEDQTLDANPTLVEDQTVDVNLDLSL